MSEETEVPEERRHGERRQTLRLGSILPAITANDL
jgi:hypothetical protein